MQISKNKIARIISTVFIPPTFTLITFLIFAFEIEADETKRVVTIILSVIFGVLAPISLFFVLRRKGRLIDQDASLKEERTFPFIIAILFYSAAFIIAIISALNIVSIAFWFCYISNTFLTILINRHWKISAHTMGALGPLAAILFLFGPVSLLFLLPAILVGWSRIQLKCHSLYQVTGGAILAFTSTYIQIYLITIFCS